ncbi:hypothetical protein ATE84_0525 [Aquimarina sp. MAR_2010_214]|uniref:hypothetical protein n=1 Tax=Aquimarina sp. MAR_2010_214 TaxID=1250026 RepID=UPI000C714E83|nr:hypothetical protein [Aquimarina sp. MAR_2010_214]PKV48526.1 hypothetical protein ATE84_0525 [Aquimarina sp. MAR_2010_214]
MLESHVKQYLKTLSFVGFFVFCFLSCSKDDTTDSTDTGGDPDPSGEQTIFEENFILGKDSKLINYVLPEAEYNKFIAGNGDFAMVSKKVYEYLNDNFDFIFILSVETEQPDGLYFGITQKVKNDVEGIGSSIYNNTASYGSQGTLKSIIHMPKTEYIRTGPFLHEIMHYWANYDFIPTTVGGHWGYSSAGGQLGGFDELTDLGGGSYKANITGKTSFGVNANGGNTVAYSNLELYLMGLITAGELQSVQVAENPSSTGNGTFTADAITTITATELITKNGARIPSQENSQKNFKAITVVISTAKLSDEKITSITVNLDNFSKNSAPDQSWGNALNFWQATGERATLEIDISQANIK